MIAVARHGETTWNLAGRYQGRQESALSALGVRQGIALGAHFFERLRNGERVPARAVSSPLLRCTATARFVTDRLGIALDEDERLIEIAHGTWEGRYRDELAANDPARYDAWRNAPARVAFDGGETLSDVLARWHAVARDLAATSDDVLVVTHDAVVRCALLASDDRSLDDFWRVPVENGAYALLQRDGGRLRVAEACVTAHLAGVRADIETQAL